MHIQHQEGRNYKNKIPVVPLDFVTSYTDTN